MKIIWSQIAYETFRENLLYLDKEWTKKDINTFINKVDEDILKISENPYLGSVYEDNNLYRRFLIVKQIYMIYRITPKREIFIVTFWNNYQDPKKLIKLLS